MQTKRRDPQPTAQVDLIAGPRSRSRNSPSVKDLTDCDYVDVNVPSSSRRISDYQAYPKPPGRRRQPIVEALNPTGLGTIRKRQGHKDEFRYSAHGRDVAQGAGQGAVPDRRRGMQGQAEVDIFNRHVALQDKSVSCGRSNYRRIVAATAFQAARRTRHSCLQPATALGVSTAQSTSR